MTASLSLPLLYEYLGFYEHQSDSGSLFLYLSPSTSWEITPVSRAELRIIKGDILAPKLSFLPSGTEVELFLKLDDLGVTDYPTWTGSPGERNPPVSEFSNEKFSFYETLGLDEEWRWKINDEYDASFKPEFIFLDEHLPSGVNSYWNGWLIKESVAIIKPDLKAVVDEGVYCECGPCSGGDCPPGTPNYSNASVSITLPLGQGADGRSAGYLMIHESRPSASLDDSSALTAFLANGAHENAENEPGVSRTFTAPLVRAHVIDDPDDNAATRDWKLEFYSNYPTPYSAGDTPYHEVFFEAVYEGPDFDHFVIVESGDLGTRKRVYDWKTETVVGRTAEVSAIVENDSIVGFRIDDMGDRYFVAPTLSVTDSQGSGVIAQADVAKGVVSAIDLLDGGAGYSEAPTVQVVEPTGTGASFEAVVVDGAIVSVDVTAQGSGYNTADTIMLTNTGGGSGAVLQPVWGATFFPTTIYLKEVRVLDSGSGYGAETTLSLNTATGSGAAMVPQIENGVLVDVSLIAGGSGYSSKISLDVAGAGDGAVLRPVLENGMVTDVIVDSQGSGYEPDAEITLVPGDNGVSPASIEAVVENGSITGFEILAGGSGYSARAQLLISGGGGSGASAAVIVADHVLADVHIIDGGTDYSSDPVVAVAPPPPDVRGGWELIYFDNDGTTPLKYEYKRQGIGDDGNPAEFLTIRDGDGTRLRETSTTFVEKAYGRKPSTAKELILDADGVEIGEIRTHFQYYENPLDASYGLLAGHWQSGNGPWEKHYYDSQGLIEKTVRQHGSSPFDGSESESAVSTYEYRQEHLDADDELEVITVRTERLLGEVVERNFSIWWGETSTEDLIGGNGQYTYREKWEVRALAPEVDTPAEAITSADVQTTKYRFDAGSTHEGTVRSVERADGTIRILEYAADGLATTTYTGAKTENAHDVASGTKHYRLVNDFGAALLEITSTYPQDLLLTEKRAVDQDDFGRILETSLLRSSGGSGAPADTVYGSIRRSYGCCGLESITDEEGLTITYDYDGLKRRYQTTRNGLTTTHSLDALNRVRSEIVNGLVHRTADYDSRGMVISEYTLFKDNLVETARSMDRSRSDYNIETVDYPDGSQEVSYYYKDGSLYQRTGSAVLPVRYAVESAEGELHTIMRRLELTEGSYLPSPEFVRTVTDMGGRVARTETAHPSGTGLSTIRNHFNERGQLEWTEDADGIRTYQTYDEFFERSGSYVNDPSTGILESVGREYVFSAEHSRVLLKTTMLEGDNPDDRLTVLTSPDGLRRWSTRYGLETSTLVERDGADFSRRDTTVYPDGTRTIVTHDTTGKLLRRERLGTDDQLLAQIEFQYDNQGRLWKSTDIRNGVTTYSYYDDGRLLSVLTPDPDSGQSGEGLDPQATSYNYAFEPGGGIRTTLTLPDAGTQVSVADPLGRTVLNYGSGMTPWVLAFDYASRPSALTTWQDFDVGSGVGSGGASVTRWVYNPAGLLQEKRYAVEESGDFESGPSYTYTAAGRLETRALARGITTRYHHNAEGLLWKTDHHDDGTAEVEVFYDTVGRPRLVADASGSRLLDYDYGQPAGETYTSGPLSEYQLTRSFDSKGRNDGFDLLRDGTSAHAVAYGYASGSGRLRTVSSGDNVFAYHYHDQSDHLSKILFNNGSTDILTQTRGIDSLNRLHLLETSDASDTTLASYEYKYDDLNRRTSVALADGNSWHYTYDALGQIDGARKKNPADQDLPGHVLAYAFDHIGNRQSRTKNGTITEYAEANSLNQYTAITVPRIVDLLGHAPTDLVMTANGLPLLREGELFFGQLDFSNETSAEDSLRAEISVLGTFPGAGDEGRDAVNEQSGAAYFPPTPYEPEHDPDGNLLRDDRWDYVWNAENRLIAMETLPAAAASGMHKQRLEFAYDSQGRRFSKKTYQWDSTSASYLLTSHSLFLYDGWNLIAEIDATDPTEKTTYAWGLDLSGTHQGAGGVGGLLMVNQKDSTFYPAYDGSGNIMSYYSADSAESVARFDYGPFGELLQAFGAKADDFVFRFSTKFEDSESGRLYYGYRYYSPETGRWMSRDPIGEDGGLNLYGFIGNDGVNWWDYLGFANLEDVVELLRAVNGAKRRCCKCPRISKYLRCMEDNIVSDNEVLTEVLDSISNSLGTVKKGTKAVETVGQAAEILNEIFRGEVVSSIEGQVAGRVNKIIGPISTAVNLGASATRGDALDLFLAVGSEFGPPGVNSISGYYLDGYRAAIALIEELPYKGGKASIIKSSSGLCSDSCDLARYSLASQFNDNWGCYKKLR